MGRGKFWVLWGWHPGGPSEPIALICGGHTLCRREQTYRERQNIGWLLAVYRDGVAPVGLRLQVAQKQSA